MAPLGVGLECRENHVDDLLHVLAVEDAQDIVLPTYLTNVVVISSVYDAKAFNQLLSWGVADCIHGPSLVPNAPHLRRLLANKVESRRIHRSSQMDDLHTKSQLLSKRRSTVLLTGETGVGKTHLAKQIHSQSENSGEFVMVNCGAFSESLVESQLFGHVEGAFTGASNNHNGVFAQAAHGTLVLDEVNSLPLHLQSRLLHVVEERKITPLGGEKPFDFTGRLLVASNQPLEELVRAGDFREDLFYRLNVVRLDIPPLRQRLDEILPIFVQTLRAGAEIEGISPPSLSRGAIQQLQSHNWPGNIRQLKNVVEYLLAVCHTPVLTDKDIEQAIASTSCPFHSSDGSVKNRGTVHTAQATTLPAGNPIASKEFLLRALAANEQNRAKTARAMGVSRTTLYKWLSKFNLQTQAK